MRSRCHCRRRLESYNSSRNSPIFGCLSCVLGAWTAETADTNQFLRATFDHATTVTHILTLGHRDLDQWVTSYTLQYIQLGTNRWTTISKDGSDVIFDGNFNRSTAVVHVLPAGITTLRLRLIPVSWSGAISMRWQLYGCYEKRLSKQEVHPKCASKQLLCKFSAQLCSSSTSQFCSSNDVTATSSEGTSYTNTICLDSTS